MRQNIIFVFILLVTLSIVNAVPHRLHKRNLEFSDCPKGDPLEVDAKPDPTKPGEKNTYEISGKLTKEIPEDSILFIGFVDPKPERLIGDPLTVNFCDDDVKCPVDAGTSFEKKEDYTTPDDLPDSYLVIVAIVSGDKKELLGCAFAAVGDIKDHDNQDYTRLVG
jgi:hypothetical protein